MFSWNKSFGFLIQTFQHDHSHTLKASHTRAWEGTCFLSGFLAPGWLKSSYERNKWSQQRFQHAPQPCIFPAANNCSLLIPKSFSPPSPHTSSGSKDFTPRSSMALADGLQLFLSFASSVPTFHQGYCHQESFPGPPRRSFLSSPSN